MTTVALVEDLFHHYKRYPWSRPHPALQSVSLGVERGEICGLVGENGAGKSTLLGYWAGLFPVRRGKAEVFGKPAGHRDVRGRVCFLPEETDRGSRLRVAEVVELQAALYGVPHRERKARTLQTLEKVGMEALASRSVASLSKGQRRRAALARVLVTNPDLLLLDEPLNGVDPLWCERIHALLRELAEQGSTIVLSSHLLVDLERACTSLAVLEDGELLDSGPLSQVLDRKDRWIVEITGTTETPPDAERIRQALGADPGTEIEVRRPLRNLADLFRREGRDP